MADRARRLHTESVRRTRVELRRPVDQGQQMISHARTTLDASAPARRGTARNRLLALLVSVAVMAVAAIGLADTASARPRTADPSTATVTGTTPDGGTVAGVFDVQRFVAQNGTL